MGSSGKKLCILLGLSWIFQAATSLAGATIGISKFTDTSDMQTIAYNIDHVYIGIFFQLIATLVFIVLTVTLYQASKGTNETVARIASCLYLLRAAIHTVGQIIVYAFAQVSLGYSESGGSVLVSLGNLLAQTRNFTEHVSLIPFGIGAALFYYLIMRAGIIPAWLGFWGIVSVLFISFNSLLHILGIYYPIELSILYIPWEWAAGVYVFAKGLNEPPEAQFND